MNEPMWQPTPEQIANSNITDFQRSLARDHGVGFSDFSAFWQWSVDHMEEFWLSFKEWADVRATTWGRKARIGTNRLPMVQWFPDARLNFAQNLLRRRDDSQAMVFWGEQQVRRALTWNQLYDGVSRLAQALRRLGIQPGDRVAAYMPNMPETIMAMLAATSVGATFTSCSPDFGVQGVLDRFGQVEPRVLFSANGYFYNGKSFDSLGKLAHVVKGLPSVEKAVVVPYTRQRPDLSAVERAVLLDDLVADLQPTDIPFAPMPFNHPVYIMYSSGTTGAPKCIVHGAGGTLLQHLKELRLHCDVKPGDRVFYFTTCGWMMWNWLVSALACEATLLLYDGSPFHPDGNVLFDFADAEGMTLFGTSAKFIDAVNKAGLVPRETHDLGTVRLMTSTGSPLAPESFDFVYEKIKPDLQLASISGGTDIIGCFVLGNPTGPVWRGEIQTRALAMAVDVFDEGGRSIRRQKGELVCTRPFPSMPVGFWNDPMGRRYQAAYFDRFPGVWCHGDWVEITEHDGVIIYGRSDATLNPGGVRIGTAEIYRQVEQMDEVLEALVVGQDWDNDVRVVLFLKLRQGLRLDEQLARSVKTRIRHNCTPRHVPARVIQVADIPRTKSGKITELAVRDVIHGRPVKNREALANPEALELYRDLPQLRD